MTNKQLQEILNKYPDELEIATWWDSGVRGTIEDVKIICVDDDPWDTENAKDRLVLLLEDLRDTKTMKKWGYVVK